MITNAPRNNGPRIRNKQKANIQIPSQDHERYK